MEAQGLTALEREAFRPIAWHSRWQQFLLLSTGILATTIVLKVSAVQWLELIYLTHIFVLILSFIRNDLRSTWYLPYLWLIALYVVFMVAALVLAVASLRFTFYIPPGLPIFGRPVYITISRVVELFASTFIMVWLADLFRQEPNKLRFTMRIYFWTGVVSALYSYFSFVANRLTDRGFYGSYLVTERLRGFYNEGGPYGLYLFTVIFVGLALYSLRWESLVRMRVGLALLPLAFYKSYSKAAFSAVLALMLVNGLFARGIGRRLMLLAGMTVIAIVGVRTVNLSEVLSVAESDSGTYERASHLHAGDGNYVLGRVAARFIVPRMISAHPLSGIGWGNYGVLRNDPQYRGASVWSDIADTPGLGVLGYAAEMGIPLLSFLIVLLFLPYLLLRRLRVATWLTNLALMSPLVHLFGAQLNVTYPWIVTAFALGLGYAGYGAQPVGTAEQPLQLSWREDPLALGTQSQAQSPGLTRAQTQA